MAKAAFPPVFAVATTRGGSGITPVKASKLEAAGAGVEDQGYCRILRAAGSACHHDVVTEADDVDGPEADAEEELQEDHQA